MSSKIQDLTVSAARSKIDAHGRDAENPGLDVGKGQHLLSDKKPDFSKKSISAFWLFFQTIYAVLIVVFAYVLKYTLTARKRGFSCTDPTIIYPFHESSIPFIILIFACNGAIIVAVVGIEIIPAILWRNSALMEKESVLYYVYGYYIHPSVTHAIQILTLSVMGYGIGTGFAFALKYSFGSLRPHFLAVCKPEELSSCSNMTYIAEFTCTNIDSTNYQLRNMLLSFPSGHTLTAFYYVVFLIIYIQARFTSRHRAWTNVCIVFYWILICLAVLVGLSRITDNKHHPSDVICGMIIGSLIAVTIMYCNKHLLKQ